MANIKIAQLTNQTAISDNDLVIVESATSTNKMTVGTLKSLLGIQSGGIVDSGSNVNGTYVKFADGSMIVTGTSVVALSGALNKGTAIDNLPVAFIDQNAVFMVNASGLNGDQSSLELDSVNTSIRQISTNGVQIYCRYIVSDTVSGWTVNIKYIGIGRWK